MNGLHFGVAGIIEFVKRTLKLPDQSLVGEPVTLQALQVICIEQVCAVASEIHLSQCAHQTIIIRRLASSPSSKV